MGTTAEKLTYLNETKTQLKTAINYGLETPLTNEPFRNYVSSIKEAFLETLRTPNTLFTNLPKKSASGSNISLTGTANAPMRIELGATELAQDGTPTPSSPQEVHTISGDNKVIVNGKNLCKLEETNLFPNSNGTVGTLSTTFNLILEVGNHTNLSVSGDFSLVDSGAVRIGGYNEYPVLNTPGTRLSNYTASYKTINVSGYKYVLLAFYRTSSSVSVEQMQNAMQVEWGTPTTYEPYISQEAEIYLGGENLFNINTIRWEFLNDSNGNVNANTSWRCTPFESNLKKNTTYTLSWKSSSSYFQANIVYYDANKTYISSASLTRAGYYNNSFTTPSSFKYYKIAYAVSVSGNDAPREEIMLNEGSTVLPYKEYIEPINYSKIGNYEDKFIRTSGKNLFDLSNPQTQSSNTPKVQDDKIVANSPTAWSSIYFTFTGLSKNTTYYIKSKLAYTSGGGAYSQIFGGSALDQSKAIKTYMSSITTSGDYSTSFSTGDNDTITISFCTSGNSGIWTLSNIMLSSEDIDYEPYGNGTWYIKKNIGKVVLDTLTFDTATSSTTGYVRFRTTSLANLIAKVGSSSERLPMLSNCYVSLSGDNNYNRTQSICAVASGNVYIYDTDYAQDTLTNFMTHLTTTGAYLYYPLATPTYTQITGTLETQLENVYQKLLSYNGTTNISQINNDLPFIMSVQAIEV